MAKQPIELTISKRPNDEQLKSYLEAYFDDQQAQEDFRAELENSDLFARAEKKALKQEELTQRFEQQQLITDLLMQTDLS